MGRLIRWIPAVTRDAVRFRVLIPPAILLLAVGCSASGSGSDDGLGLQAAPLLVTEPVIGEGSAANPDLIVDSDTELSEPVQSESALERIRQRGEVRVGVLFNYPPFGYLTDQGNVEGFEVDLATAMAEKWGVSVKFVQVTRQTGIPYLLNDNIDLVAAAMPHRRELHEAVDFSQTIFRSGYLLLVDKNGEAAIENMSDLSGETIGLADDAALDVVHSQTEELGVSVATRTYDTIDNAVVAMLDGQVSAVVGRREALMLATQLHANVGIVNEFLSLEPYAFAMRRGDVGFRNLIDITLQSLAADATYAELFQEHFYQFPADLMTIWPGASSPDLNSIPATVQTPEQSIVERLRRGEPLSVAGLQLEYDEPELDGQRLFDDFNRALINEMARRWGVSVSEMPDSSGDAGRVLVESGQADMAVGIQPSRDKIISIAFSQSYLERGLRLLRLDDVDIEGIDDLNSPRSAAVVNSASGARLIRDENIGTEIFETNSPQEALSLLQTRAAWVVLADEFTAGLLTRQGPNIVLMDEVFLPITYAIGLPRSDSDFRALVNFTLQAMSADGTLNTLTQQYFGPYMSQSNPFQPLPIEQWPGNADYLGITISR